tara:strand:- start:2080 stop:2424 length:345 start_codon:yes stop_codon:yes gene_type:complete
MIITQGPHEDLNSIEQLNEEKGYHYFEEKTMRFFSSNAYETIYAGCIFITSEKFMSRHGNGPRRYSLRCIRENGTIDTIGEFQGYETFSDAGCDAEEIQSIIDLKGEYNDSTEA